MAVQTIKDHIIRAQKALAQGKYQEVIDVAGAVACSPGEEGTALRLLAAEASLYHGCCPRVILLDTLESLRLTDNNELYGKAKFLLGWSLAREGSSIDAIECLQEASVYFRRYNKLLDLRRALSILAQIAFQTLDRPQVESYTEKILSILRSAGEEDKACLYQANLARLYLRLGYLRKAKGILDENAQQLLAYGVRSDINFHLSYCLLLVFQNNLSQARISLRTIEQKVGAFSRENAIYHEYLGHLCIHEHLYDSAESNLGKALKDAVECAAEGDMVSQIKRLFGDLYVATHKWDLAEKYAFEALAVAEKINERLEIAACHRVFAQVARHREHDEKARRWYKKAIDLFNLIGAHYELAVTRYLAATSGLYEKGERQALLYLAREYFESEEVTHYVDKIDAVLNRNRPPHPVRNLTRGCPTIVAVNRKMREMIELAEHVARSEMTVLLTGATGTGKDLLAEYIHHCSGRSGRLVSFNAAAVQDTLVESELFGSARGAFTGSKDRPGLLEEADKGTFYLNEIADATPLHQAKLLEVLETRSIRRLGESKTRPVAFRLIAATNRDLQQRMRDNLFRPDLYHRLNEIHINLPSLSERTEDIPALVYHFLTLAGFDTTNGNARDIEHLGEILARYRWPGNIRQLQAEVNRMWLEAKGDVSMMVRLALECGEKSEHEQLLEVLEQTDGNRSKAAKLLGVSEGTIRYRLKKLRIHITC